MFLAQRCICNRSVGGYNGYDTCRSGMQTRPATRTVMVEAQHAIEKDIDYVLINIMFLTYWDFLPKRGGVPCVPLYLTTEFSALATLPSI